MALLLVSLSFSLKAQGTQVITFKTSFNIGDSVRLKVVSFRHEPVMVEGLTEDFLVEDWKKYEIENQTIKITGPVMYLAVFKNGVTEITFDNAVYLDRIDCEENKLKSLDLSSAYSITHIYCHKNNIETLVTKGADALTSLECRRNNLKTLDVSSNPLLESLSCGDNQLTSIKLTGCNKLLSLTCENNQLSNIELAPLTNLEYLRCYKNKLTGLDFTANTKMMHIDTEANQIGADAMLALVKSLSKPRVDTSKPASIGVFDASFTGEKNVCNSDAVKIAQDKGWKVIAFMGNKYEPYPGKDVVAIDAPYRSEKPMVYPTVATNELYLLDECRGQALSIYAMSGELVLSEASATSSVVNVAMLPEGSYVIRIGDHVSRFLIRR